MEKMIHLPVFFTATIKGWKHLLKLEKYKIIILQNLKHLVEDNKIVVYAYCIMSNHIHIIWQIKGEVLSSEIQKSFLENTAKKIKSDLEIHHPEVLKLFASTQKDRVYHFWKRRPLSIDLFTPAVFEQKVDYIHNNPVTAGSCELPEQYVYSSARYYHDGFDEWKILTHYNL
jgi:putative transposase